ncbi:thioesterase family protein [Thalassobius sp. Cn5-15]|uniref:acyl-CoA thioesterase n=1 Tax=Thalassobius sp. Cn5-15 TaxID=2917763 RepID=UPI001EF29A02|nr:thioesterase family protein [Thalassobius sp. Cn5-15]MCG7493532.1 acyl-CoA thioesterase [Thalassobius sp. Cn5-15]
MSTQNRGTRADYVDFYPLQTRWNDNDVYGHMNNVVHYALFDTAVNGWLMDRGLLDPHTSTTIGLVVETGCKYFAEMAFPDQITAGLRVAHLGTSSISYELGLFRNEEEQASAEGRFVHVYVDRASRRPAPIEGERREAFQALMRG